MGNIMSKRLINITDSQGENNMRNFIVLFLFMINIPLFGTSEDIAISNSIWIELDGKPYKVGWEKGSNAEVYVILDQNGGLVSNLSVDQKKKLAWAHEASQAIYVKADELSLQDLKTLEEMMQIVFNMHLEIEFWSKVQEELIKLGVIGTSVYFTGGSVVVNKISKIAKDELIDSLVQSPEIGAKNWGRIVMLTNLKRLYQLTDWVEYKINSNLGKSFKNPYTFDELYENYQRALMIDIYMKPSKDLIIKTQTYGKDSSFWDHLKHLSWTAFKETVETNTQGDWKLVAKTAIYTGDLMGAIIAGFPAFDTYLDKVKENENKWITSRTGYLNYTDSKIYKTANFYTPELNINSNKPDKSAHKHPKDKKCIYGDVFKFLYFYKQEDKFLAAFSFSFYSNNKLNRNDVVEIDLYFNNQFVQKLASQKLEYDVGVLATKELFDIPMLGKGKYTLDATILRNGIEYCKVVHSEIIDARKNPFSIQRYVGEYEGIGHLNIEDDLSFSYSNISRNMSSCFVKGKFVQREDFLEFNDNESDCNILISKINDDTISIKNNNCHSFCGAGTSIINELLVQEIKNKTNKNSVNVEFSDDFNQGLRKWKVAGSPIPSIVSKGNPKNSFCTNDDLNYGGYAITKDEFDASNGLIIQLDMKPGHASFPDQRFAGIQLRQDNTIYVSGQSIKMSKQLAGMMVTADNYGTTRGWGKKTPGPWVSCIISNGQSTGDYERKNEIPIRQGSGWHHYTIKLNKNGTVEFYMDNVHLYRSDTKLSNLELKHIAISLGGRLSYYDNIKVMKER